MIEKAKLKGPRAKKNATTSQKKVVKGGRITYPYFTNAAY